ncbi:MAG: hypothetical protein U1D70_16265 [Methylobacter sp.]|nr:hypothetical protein [Methylobacter sp.]MDP2428677.1 hypothetical protein [Methylobacter sp.]MDP3055157.1 hypothetical protein [Methylobacter sp.]MDP3360545.1 hypothetical protein [Methylobacter sp.]MDZ4220559.1 hypothetical protein [Methylobacter sp.]
MNLDKMAHEMMMSPTLERLFHLAQGVPCDTNKPEELRAALAVAGNELIRALDNGRIHFDNDLDKAMLYGLLTVTTDFVMHGKLKMAFKPSTRQ